MLSSLFSLLLLLNLGVHGQTYSIEEPDLQAEIEAKAKSPAVQQEAEEKLRKSYIADIYLPDVKEKSKREKTFTYTVPEDLIIDGNLVAKKGQVVNILEKVKLTTKYLFLKDYQMPLFEQLSKKDRNIAAVVILGDLLPMIEKHPNHRIYMGSMQLVNKFGITGVPSMVYQEGTSIIVEEMPYVTKH
jgi:conjugal transfer pilus assembly protein TraW